jgi:NTP pyrophosphatase (non-canonical NTP hydrolase)
MDCTSKNIGQLEMDALIVDAATVYAKLDRNRTLWDVWSHALHHAAAVAEEIRKRSQSEANDEKLKQEIADLALWLFTILVKLRGPIGTPIHKNEVPQDWVVRISVGASDLMWNRYPGICPWCYCATHTNSSDKIDELEFWQPCSCDSLRIAVNKKDSRELRERAKRTRRLAELHSDRRPRTLDGWQDKICSLYRERLTQASLTEVALHLLEEMGEVSDGLIRMYAYLERDLNQIEDEIVARQVRLEDELADVLSWLFGLVECMNEQGWSQPLGGSSAIPREPSDERLYLSQILWRKYGSDEKRAFWCRHCKEVNCGCRIHLIQEKAQVEDILSRLSTSRKMGSD